MSEYWCQSRFSVPKIVHPMANKLQYHIGLLQGVKFQKTIVFQISELKISETRWVAITLPTTLFCREVLFAEGESEDDSESGEGEAQADEGGWVRARVTVKVEMTMRVRAAMQAGLEISMRLRFSPLKSCALISNLCRCSAKNGCRQSNMSTKCTASDPLAIRSVMYCIR